MAQVTVMFSDLQHTQNSSMRKRYEKRVSIFSNFQKPLSLLHAQVNDKCPDSSHLILKRHCSTTWIKNYDVVFDQCNSVVVRASALQSVDLGFIPLVESYKKTLKNRNKTTSAKFSPVSYQVYS